MLHYASMRHNDGQTRSEYQLNIGKIVHCNRNVCVFIQPCTIILLLFLYYTQTIGDSIVGRCQLLSCRCSDILYYCVYVTQQRQQTASAVQQYYVCCAYYNNIIISYNLVSGRRSYRRKCYCKRIYNNA